MRNVWHWQSVSWENKSGGSGRLLAIVLSLIKGLVIAWLFFAGSHNHAAVIAVRDDANQTITLQKPALRIATLAPSLTELAFAAGAGKQVVAVSAYSDFPVEAKMRPQVADFAGVSLEALLVQKPDLVIAWKSGNREIDLKRIRELDIPLYIAEVTRMSDVPRVLRDIGMLAGTQNIADKAAADFEARAQALKDRFSGKSDVSVFFEIAREPLMTVSDKHAIGEIVKLCGGRNVFGDATLIAFAPSLEKLVSLNPQAIIYPAVENGPSSMPWPRYQVLDAWKSKQIYRVDPDPILRPGPRSIEGAEQVCRVLAKVRESIVQRP
jgi:iron complex transport system substrate-binding protein